MKVVIYKKDIETNCELCEAEDVTCQVVQFEDGRVYLACKSCTTCLERILKFEVKVYGGQYEEPKQ
jgi:uncharacterized Zn finger protein